VFSSEFRFVIKKCFDWECQKEDTESLNKFSKNNTAFTKMTKAKSFEVNNRAVICQNISFVSLHSRAHSFPINLFESQSFFISWIK